MNKIKKTTEEEIKKIDERISKENNGKKIKAKVGKILSTIGVKKKA